MCRDGRACICCLGEPLVVLGEFTIILERSQAAFNAIS